MKRTTLLAKWGLIGAASACAASAAVGVQPAPQHEEDESIVRRRRAGLQYTENLGQWNTPALYVARAAGLTVRLEADGFWLQKIGIDRATGERKGALVHVAFEGALATARLEPDDPDPGRSHYLLGSDRSRWVRDVRSFGSVTYRGLADGLDLEFTVSQGLPRFDLIVEPWAGLATLTFHVEGAECLEVGPDGALVSSTSVGDLRFSAPIAWEEIEVGASARSAPVDAQWVKTGERKVGLEAQKWSRAGRLVIDPTVLWATFLGGARDEYCEAVDIDDAGNVTVGGWSESPNFPTTLGALDETNVPDVKDGFVSRILASGSVPLYSTYLGGDQRFQGEFVSNILVDSDSRVIALVEGGDPTYPITPGAYVYPPTIDGTNFDVFFSKLRSDGSDFVYSGRIGGLGTDSVVGAVLGVDSTLYFGGFSGSQDLPVTGEAFQSSLLGPYDGYICKLTPNADQLVACTFLGGAQGGAGSDGIYCLDIAPSGDLLVGGTATTFDFPITADAFQPVIDPDGGGFVARMSGDLKNLLYSSFLGGDYIDYVNAVRPVGNKYYVVGGYTHSSDFPLTPDALVGTDQPYFDGFVSLFSTADNSLIYSSLIGGGGDDEFRDFIVHRSGAIIAAGDGFSNSTTWPFPITGGEELGPTGGAGIFMLNPFGSAMTFANWYGGSVGPGQFLAMTMRQCDYANGRAVMAGTTSTKEIQGLDQGIDDTFNGTGTLGWGDVFATVVDMTLQGVETYGASTDSCSGVTAIGVLERPFDGAAGFGLTCIGAPSGAAGFLLVSLAADSGGTPFLGLPLYVDLASNLVLVAASADAWGRAQVPLPLPAGIVGAEAYAQFAWIDLGSCGVPGALHASEGLHITVQAPLP